jgi:hypothetical protein
MILKKIFILIISAALFSCGIDEYFFLPQLDENNVTTYLNTEAVINLPPIPDEFYYAGSYTIFYRIYISNFQTMSSTDISQISPALASDYNFYSQLANPANTSSIMSLNNFKNRNYFELEFEGADIASVLPKDGGILRINFPTYPEGYPTASIDGGPAAYRLRRSSQLISPEPRNDLSFRNSSELRSYENANANINADVAGRTGEMQFAYVSMYIVALGTNPVNFTPIYSKPTHISVFRLPDTN